MLEVLSIEKLSGSPDNPRRSVGDVKELAASIAAVGILEPLVVTADGNGGYVVVAGARRLAGAKAAGLAEVPCIVRELTDEQQAEVMLVENLQREDLSPLEEASAYRRLTELGWSQRQLAERIGRSQAHISKRMALLELPEKVHDVVDSGGITIEAAVELGKVADHPEELEEILDGYDTTGREGPVTAADVRWDVENAIRARDREAKIAALVEKAKAGPHRYVDAARGAWRLDPQAPEWQHEVLRMRVKEHSKEACHAVTVSAGVVGEPQITHLCTEPKRHPEGKTPKRKLTEAERRRKAHETAMREAARARRAFVREVLTGRGPKKGDVLEAVVPVLVEEVWQSKAKLACDLLGLEIPERKQRYGSATKDPVAALREHMEKGERQLLQVGLAVVFAVAEESFGGYHGKERDGRYFATLKRYGYEPSGAEKKELARKEPR